MFKTISLVLMMVSLSLSASSQTQAKKEPPNLRLTLSTGQTTWLLYKPAPVRVTIENLAGHKVELPSNIYFRLDNRESEDEGPTRAHDVFWSPVSLTKTYSEDATGCQNDLTQDRVEVLKDTNIVSISPPKDGLFLEKDEKKEFSFDLARTCWNHAISSIYPDGNLFSYIKASPADKLMGMNSYKVYFEMEFRIGTAKVDGMTSPVPLAKRLRSNEVEIVFD